MRYVRLFLILGLLVGMAGMGTAMADTKSVTVPMSVTLAQDLSLTSWVNLGFSSTGQLDQTIPYSSMAFGPLRYNSKYSYYAPDVYFCVFLSAHTTGRKYQITMSPMNNLLIGTNNISKKIVITPGYSGMDRLSWGTNPNDPTTSTAQDAPTNATPAGLGPLTATAGQTIGGASLANLWDVTKTSDAYKTYAARPSVATQSREIYNSGTDTSARIIRCYVGFYTSGDATDKSTVPGHWGTPAVTGTSAESDAMLMDKDIPSISGTLSSTGGTLTFTVTTLP